MSDTKKISMRIPAELNSILEEQAERLNTTKTEIITSALLGELSKVKPVRPLEVKPETATEMLTRSRMLADKFEAIFRELHRQGVNLNQLTANSNKDSMTILTSGNETLNAVNQSYENVEKELSQLGSEVIKLWQLFE